VDFAELLRTHRRAAGLTLEDLAEASGVSARAISDMERGQSLGQRRTVAALAAALVLSTEDDAALLAAARSGRARRLPTGAAPGECELPRPVPDFTGRTAELAWIAELAWTAGQTRTAGTGPAAVALVAGLGGVGKTALVVRAAEQLADRFPDGRLFVDLRGMDAVPLDPADALARLLRALRMPDRRIPAGLDERAGHYRALLRDRRCLVVLDNVASESQVRPLLPGEGASLALLTSRRPLSGLEGLTRSELHPLSTADASGLLRAIVGTDRTAAEAGTVAQLAQLCGNLPLALRIAGNRLLSRPGWTVRQLAARLADPELRLRSLTAGDLAVAVPFTLSYGQLSPAARRTFRRLALVPGPHLGVALTAVLAGCGLLDAEDALDELVELGLLQSTPVERYRFHDLLRLYAHARLTEEPAADRRAAEDRMTGWLLDVAVVAGRWYEPDFGAPPPGWSDLVELDTSEQAADWLTTESDNWLPALRTADPATVVEVAEAMHWFSDRWTHWPHWSEVYGRSAAAARALGDRRLEAVHLNYLAWARAGCDGDFRGGADTALAAYEVAAGIGDLGQQAWAMNYAANAYFGVPDPVRGLDAARRSAALFERAADWDGYAQAEAALGEHLRRLGRPEEAIERFGRSWPRRTTRPAGCRRPWPS
jgi:transcriptional regulator with XRE-family HTH domain/tetratricopeptide (TPR) repeat protein